MRFSIIIPLYNKAPYIANAIHSVFSQTFTDYELVIVDDGSKDDSAEIATKAIEGRKNCRLIHQENEGVSMARNNGVAASHGDYLCFLDADDWWEPTFLEEMSKLIVEFPDAGIYGTNYTIVNEIKRKTRVAKIGVEEGFEKGYINYCQAYAKTMYMPLWTGAVCIPRYAFDETQGFPVGIRLGEDFMLWMYISLKHKVVLLNKPLSNYNQDVDVTYRGTNHLTAPEYNYLWHTDVFGDAERSNPDVKLLFDRLRAYDLQPYYLSQTFHAASLIEIEKIDQGNISFSLRRFYSQPLVLARAVAFLRKKVNVMVRRVKNWLDRLSSRKWTVGIVEGGIDEVFGDNMQIRWLKHQYKDRWFADPFILDIDDDSIVLLVEEYIYQQKKGRIAKLVVDRNEMCVVDNQTLLETPLHLSFPVILRHEGRVFVYPENSATGRLSLYEYEDKGLRFVTSLCDEPLTDAVITSRFGKHRIYATKMPDPNGNILEVYQSESLFGPYCHYEDIKFNANDARMAGDFFEHDGVAFKPSQDCNGKYGKAIRLFETKDGKTFKLHSVLQSTHPRLREGMHTINSYKEIAVVDVVGFRYPIAGRIISFLVSIKKRVKR